MKAYHETPPADMAGGEPYLKSPSLATRAGAARAPIPHLIRQTPSSFRTKDTTGVVDFLTERGLASIPTCSQKEAARLANPDHSILAVIYRTGSVVAQGRDRAVLADYLDRYAHDPEPWQAGGAA